MTVFLFAGTPARYLDRPVGDADTLTRVKEFVSSLSDVREVRVLTTREVEGLPAQWQQVVEESWGISDVVGELAGSVNGADDLVLFCHLDQPFVNRELTGRLLDRHERYRADYTFADGFPAGLAPELLRGRALAYLRELADGSGEPVERDALFRLIQKDMNRFDIETELSTTDQRLLRLNLAVDTLANYTLCSSLARNEPSAIDDWVRHVEENRALHRTLPAYLSVQVLEQEVHELTYSPYPAVHSRPLAPGAIMSVGRFETLLDELLDFAPEAVVSISHWGEVALHPEVDALISAVASRPPLRLIVETSGVGWQKESRDLLFSKRDVTVIVGLDTTDPAAYRQIRGEGFSEAMDFAEQALEDNPERTYVQAVRSEITEPTLDDFYSFWSERTANVIIQKYDWFCGRLPDRKLGDLAPVNRFPCWHLQRDLTILVDGSVPLCREDLRQSRRLGNVFEDGLEGVWRKGDEAYSEHISGVYQGICEKCDEYYTYNF